MGGQVRVVRVVSKEAEQDKCNLLKELSRREMERYKVISNMKWREKKSRGRVEQRIGQSKSESTAQKHSKSIAKAKAIAKAQPNKSITETQRNLKHSNSDQRQSKSQAKAQQMR
jgi:hypothetical protein